MRKAILLVLILPLLGFGQNITNTLGTSGTFVVEDNGNNVLISANRTSSTDFIVIGDYAITYNLPPYSASNLGTVIFPQNNASSRLDFISSGAGHKSFLNFLYTPGSLVSPLDLQNDDVLGLIEFGGYFNTSWRSNAAKFEVVVSGTPSGIANIPTEMRFTNNAAGTPKTMTFNNDGNLTVPGAVTSQAIRVVNGTANILVTDQVIISTTASTFTLPDISTVPVGKTYTFKKADDGNFAITIQGNGTIIDGAASISNGSNNTLDHVTIISDGINWWVIGQGSGL